MTTSFKLFIILIFILFVKDILAQNNSTKFIKNKFEIPAYSVCEVYSFDYMWVLYGLESKQIDDNQISRLINIFDKFSTAYPKEIIQNNISKIYLLQELKLGKENIDVNIWGDVLYVSVQGDSKIYSDEELIMRLHEEFTGMLLSKYINRFPTKEWRYVNSANFTYSDSTFIDSIQLNKSGFVSEKSLLDIKSDISSFAYLYKYKKERLDTLCDNYKRIHEKKILLQSFYKALEDKIYSNNEIDIKVSAMKDKYGINIIYDYSIYNYPLWWLKGKTNAQGKQMSKENVLILIDVIDSFLLKYDKYFAKQFLKNIYVVSDLQLNNNKRDAILNLSNLYISDNSIDNISNYKQTIGDEYFLLFYKNFDSYFPKKEWNTINEESSMSDSVFLSKKGRSRFYYDNKDFWYYYLTIKDSVLKDSVIKQKYNLYSNFYNRCDSVVKTLDHNVIANSLLDLEKRYSVEIIYKSPKKDIVKPLDLRIDEEINLLQLNRYVSILDDFLSYYPKSLIKNNLKKIYLYGGMHNSRSNNYIAGTFEINTLSLFLVNIGNSDEFLLGALHHELSSLLLHSNMEIFPKQEWLDITSPDFSYKPTSRDIYLIKEVLNEQGFINEYGTTYYENDYNEFAKLYILDQEKLIELANKYEKIKLKYDILDKFYKAIE